MSQRYKGAVISATPPATTGGNSGTAPGIWTMQQQLQAQGANAWPSFTPVYIEDVFSTYLYTGNGTSQSINNGIALGNSNGGGSVLFDGAGDWLSVASSSGFNLGTGDFTVECWVYRTAASGGYETMLGFDVTGGLLFELYGNQLDFGIRGTANNTSGVTVPSYQWVHLALARQSGVVRYFQNGSLIYTYTGTYATQNFTNNTAALISSYSPGAGVFNGYISNLRLVKGTALYTSSFTPSTTPLTAVSGTSLLTCQGSTPLVDNSGNALAITKNGDSSAQVFGPFTVTGVGQGGLVWTKSRSGADDHRLWDTSKGGWLVSNTTGSSQAPSININNTNTYMYATTSGFAYGVDSGTGVGNDNGTTYASWTFRKQPKFFDVVTWTGDGATSKTISHNLGSVPGCIIVKRTNAVQGWCVYHRSVGNTAALFLQSTNAPITYNGYWNDTSPTSTQFTVGVDNLVNASGGTYVAYLFAHDAGGFGTSNTDNVISCGSFTTDGSGTATINLGYEPQWILVKNTNGTADNWDVWDTMRGWQVNTGDRVLYPNQSSAETNGDPGYPTATGFYAGGFFYPSTNYIYVAIRRGPMKTPTSGTSVFTPVTATASNNLSVTAGFPPDLAFVEARVDGVTRNVIDRLRGGTTARIISLESASTGAEQSYSGNGISFNSNSTGIIDNFTNFNQGAISMVYWMFRRAPSFMDVVCYSGTSATQSVNHNLGVVPELIILKRRSSSSSWPVWRTATGTGTSFIYLNDASGDADQGVNILTATPTTTAISLSSWGGINGSGSTYVAYLFASCPGVSKVGSYTGTGATLTISCGFAARWVMIKRTDSTGNWWVWDTARGMVAGTDPRLAFNLASAETNANWVYTDASGFQIVTTDATVNASGGSYIYLAIA